jgi:1,2-diacylglycerol 3-beta-glucosyltransferase
MTHPAAVNIRWRVALPVVAILAIALGGLAFRSLALFQALTVFTTVYGLIVFSVGAWAYRSEPRAKDIVPDEELPMVSILIPAHNEEMVIGNTLNSILKLDYPRFEVVVIDDHSSDATAAILREYPIKVVTRRNLPNRGKSEALNAGLEVAHGDVICVFDADSEVAPDFLRLAVAPLVDNPEICGVQAQVRMYNRKTNFLTAGQDDEFALFCEITQMGRYTLGGASALGGNGQLTRRSAIKAVGGWSPASLTEDLDLTIRLLLAGRGRIAHCSEASVWQEGVTEFGPLIRQRTRWAEGMLRCYGEFIGQVIRSKEMPLGLKLDAAYVLLNAFIPLFSLAGLVYTAVMMGAGLAFVSLPTPVLAVMGLTSIAALVAWSLMIGYKREQALTVMPVLRSMVYLLHWIPSLLIALGNIFRDQPVVWVKTEHRGHGLVHAGHAGHTLTSAAVPVGVVSEPKASV